MRHWSCAGRSYPSHSTSRSPPTWWEGCARREQVAPIRPEAGIGRVLVWACFVRRKFSPHLADLDGERASGYSHATSKHRAAYSRRLVSLQAARSLCHTCGMHASRGQRRRHASKKAASAGPCVHARGNRCDLIEINSPDRDEWLPLAACSNAPDVSRKPTDPRASGRSWATAVALPSRTSRGSASLRRRCAVCAAGLGMGMPCDSCG